MHAIQVPISKKSKGGCKSICSALGQDAVSVRKYQRWFEKFGEENFSLGDDCGRTLIQKLFGVKSSNWPTTPCDKFFTKISFQSVTST